MKQKKSKEENIRDMEKTTGRKWNDEEINKICEPFHEAINEALESVLKARDISLALFDEEQTDDIYFSIATTTCKLQEFLEKMVELQNQRILDFEEK